MAKKRHHSSMHHDGHRMSTPHGYYEGMNETRRLEKMDSEMIQEDRHAMANLPQNVIMKAYPRPYNYMPEELNDEISGVDGQIRMDESQRNRKLDPKKV